MYVPPLESCESEESSRGVYEGIGDHFHVAKIEKKLKECILDRISCSGTQTGPERQAGYQTNIPPTPACAIKTNNPMGYPMVGTIILKVRSVHRPFSSLMYIVKQTGDVSESVPGQSPAIGEPGWTLGTGCLCRVRPLYLARE